MCFVFVMDVGRQRRIESPHDGHVVPTVRGRRTLQVVQFQLLFDRNRPSGDCGVERVSDRSSCSVRKLFEVEHFCLPMNRDSRRVTVSRRLFGSTTCDVCNRSHLGHTKKKKKKKGSGAVMIQTDRKVLNHNHKERVIFLSNTGYPSSVSIQLLYLNKPEVSQKYCKFSCNLLTL